MNLQLLLAAVLGLASGGFITFLFVIHGSERRNIERHEELTRLLAHNRALTLGAIQQRTSQENRLTVLEQTANQHAGLLGEAAARIEAP